MTAPLPDTTIAGTDAPRDMAPGPRTLILPRQNWRLELLSDVWRYRELLLILAARDIKVRYRQAVIGAAWAVLQPVLTLAIFLILFHLFEKTPTRSAVPYAVTAYCAILPWQFFAKSLTTAGTSLINNRDVITKVYFPRMLLPTASVLTALVDLAIACPVLAGLMAWYNIAPTALVLLLPVVVAIATFAALGAGLWLSALTGLYRDFYHLVPFVIQLGFYVSPVVYETDGLIPERWRLLYAVNPLVVVLEGFRWCLLGIAPPRLAAMLISLASVAVMFVTGLAYFRRVETVLADRI